MTDEVKNDPYSEAKKQALADLIAYYGNSPLQLSKHLGVHEQTYYGWAERGQVGKSSAIAIDERDDIPFTKEQLRPDVKVW